MILSKYFNKKYLYLLCIVNISSMQAFNEASIKSIFEEEKTKEVKKIQYKNEYQLVSLIPFEEGEKLVSEDELKYMQELKMISMQEFDDADTKQGKELKIEIEEEIEIERTKEEEIKQEEIKQEEIEKPNLEIKPKIKKIKSEIEIKKEKPIFQIKKIEQKEFNNIEDTSSIYDILAYEQILIEIDSNTNQMKVKAKINNQYKEIKTYKVSTAKENVQKPLGIGNISKISLKPTWYPTQSTKKSFKKRGIILPDVVPYGHKYNYMGAAKINLTHVVNGRSTYRIHGTLNKKTIGTNESAGCIRMKNSDVLQLSSLLNKFSDIKNMNKIQVLLK